MKKGFTLIEILVVIAVIGVLAAVLFVAINPLEQINKANDGGKVTTAREIIDAAERYYTTFQEDPTNSCGATGSIDENELEDTGELKDKDYSAFTLNCSTGSYTVDFTPSSNTYTQLCGPTEDPVLCTIPDDIIPQES